LRLLGTFLLVALLFHGLAFLAQSEFGKTTDTMGKGQTISTAVATVTGTAISPLVGVCAIGIFDYFRTPKDLRGQLPLYEKPKFWIPISVLLLLILLKDTVGGFAPLIKKPLDAIEVLMLNKASLILIGFPVVFHEVAKIMGLNSVSQLFSLVMPRIVPVVYAANVDVGSTARAAGNAVLGVIMIVVGMVTMFVVWMLGETFDVLALLSPFPFLDFLFKAARNGLFLILAIATLINREAGLTISLAIILISFVRHSFFVGHSAGDGILVAEGSRGGRCGFRFQRRGERPATAYLRLAARRARRLARLPSSVLAGGSSPD
jgi:hypothetical protein